MRRELLWIAAWTLCFLSISLHAQEQPLEASEANRFTRTVYYVQNGPAQLQADFSSVALAELALVHATEAELAREEIESSAANQKLRNWALSVDQYAKQLEVLIEEVVAGISVSILQRPDGLLALTVGERAVILSHPRLAQQHVLEQSILANFCTQHACDQFTPSNLPLVPIAVTTASVFPQWGFSGDGHTCSYRGIVVLFTASAELTRAKTLCTQFYQEVMTLVDEMAWQQRHAVIVDWNSIHMFANPARPEHRVQLNANGDSILVALPLLFQDPGLLRQVTRWIKVFLEEPDQARLSLGARDFGWEKVEIIGPSHSN